MTDAPPVLEASRRRRRRDYLSPVLLTVSIHLMFFTLLINQRLFMAMGQPMRSPGDSIVNIGIDKGEDMEIGKDPGAAPGEPAESVGQRPQSVRDAMKSDATPNIAVRESETVKQPSPTAEAAPKDDRSLADRLNGSFESTGGGEAGESSVVVPGGGSHGLRGKGKHGTGLDRNGGGAGTETAVQMGLAWLASVQDSDGRWDSDGFMVHYLKSPSFEEKMAEGPGGTYKDVGLTALCLLAFTGTGCTESDPRYGRVVREARKFLLAEQRPEDGGFGGRKVQSSDMYDHAVSTLAIADLYLVSGDDALRQPLKRALLYLLSQQRKGGGWTYQQFLPSHAGTKFIVEERNDLSITGWCVLALVAGREAGFEIPEDNVKKLVAYLRKATSEDGMGIYADKSPRAGDRGLGMTAVSNICRRLLGEKGDSPMQKRQRDILADHPPNWDHIKDRSNGSYYFWYYGSIALLLGKDEPGGEDRWKEWNVGLKRALLTHQCTQGGRRGSFDPLEFWADQGGGGRLYATAINVLSLEIYYRFEPGYLKSRASELSRYWEK